MNIRKYMSNMRGNLPDVDADDVLGLMGLQKRSSGDWVFPMLAGVGAGMAIGAGLALFLTPYRGDEVREKVRRSAADAQRMLNDRVGQLSEKVGQLSEKVGLSEKMGEIKGTPAMSTGSNVATSRTVGVGGAGGNRGI